MILLEQMKIVIDKRVLHTTGHEINNENGNGQDIGLNSKVVERSC